MNQGFLRALHEDCRVPIQRPISTRWDAIRHHVSWRCGRETKTFHLHALPCQCWGALMKGYIYIYISIYLFIQQILTFRVPRAQENINHWLPYLIQWQSNHPTNRPKTVVSMSWSHPFLPGLSLISYRTSWFAPLISKGPCAFVLEPILMFLCLLAKRPSLLI